MLLQAQTTTTSPTTTTEGPFVTPTPIRAAWEMATDLHHHLDTLYRDADVDTVEEARFRTLRDQAEQTLSLCQEAYRLSHEPRTWQLIEEGHGYDVCVGTKEEALSEARRNIERAVYGDTKGTIWIEIRVLCEETGESESETVTCDPDAPPCKKGKAHDWQSPNALLGGLEEHPGALGHGGGVIVHEACPHCGCKKTTDTWARHPTTGREGLRSVSYEEHAFRVELPTDEET